MTMMGTYAEELRDAKPLRSCAWADVVVREPRLTVTNRCDEPAVQGTFYCAEHLSVVHAEAGS